MSEKIIFKIIDLEAKQLVQTAMLLSDDKYEAADILVELYEEAMRQLWRPEQ